MALTTEHMHLASIIHNHVQTIEAQGGGDEGLLHSLYDYPVTPARARHATTPKVGRERLLPNQISENGGDMHKTHIIGASLLIACSVAAQANNGWYFSASGGPSFADDVNFTVQGRNVTAEFDVGFNVNGALGYRLGRFRLEGELSYLKNDLDKVSFGGSALEPDGDLSILGGLASLYFDILVNSRWTPYLGGGIGIANVSANDVAAGPFSVGDKDDNAFAYQVKAGLSYSLSDSIQAILGYRLFGADDLDIENIDGPEIHNIEAGIHYLF